MVFIFRKVRDALHKCGVDQESMLFSGVMARGMSCVCSSRISQCTATRFAAVRSHAVFSVSYFRRD